MVFIKENKITLIICTSLIAIALFIVYFIDNKGLFNKYEYSEKNEYLKKYEVNEIVSINMDEEQMARKYLAQYVKLIYLDPDKAYELLVPAYKEKRFGSIDKFKKHFTNLFSDRFFNANVKQLKVSIRNNYKEFYVVDENDNVFIFNEHSIMQYEVMFDNITI